MSKLGLLTSLAATAAFGIWAPEPATALSLQDSAEEAFRRELKARRAEAERRLGEARETLRQRDAEAARRATALAERVRGKKIGVTLKSGKTHEDVTPLDATVTSVRLRTGGKELSIAWDLMTGASVLELARLVFDDGGAEGLETLGRVLAARRLWKPARETFATAKEKGAPDAEEFELLLDELLEKEDRFRGLARSVGGTMLELRYDFETPDELADFVGPAGKSHEPGGLILESKNLAVWSLREAALEDVIEIELGCSGGGTLIVRQGNVELEVGGDSARLLSEGRELAKAKVPDRSEDGSLRVRLERRGRRVRASVQGRPLLSAEAEPAAGPAAIGVRGGKIRIAAPLEIQGGVDPEALGSLLELEEAIARRASESGDSLYAAMEEEREHRAVGGGDRRLSADHVYFARDLKPGDLAELSTLREQAAQFAARGGGWSDPTPGLERLIERCPGHPVLQYLLGLCLRHRSAGGGDPQGATRCFERALEIFPEFWEARLELAELWLERWRLDRAQEHVEKALEAKPDAAAAHALKGYLRGLRGDTGAWEDLDLAFELHPRDPVVRRYRTRLKLGMLRGADIGLPYSAETEHYSVSTDIDEASALAYARRLEGAFGHFHEAFKGSFEARENYRPPRVLIFKSRSLFHSFNWLTSPGRSEHTAGHYNPALNQLVLYEEPDAEETLHVLYHEAFHHFMSLMVRTPPYWFNEGIAEYFGGITVEDGKVVESGKVLRDVLSRVRGRLDGGTFYPFSRLMQEEPHQFYSADSRDKYDQAWSMIHFFCHAEGGRYRTLLDRYFERLRAGDGTRKAYRAAFDGKTEELEEAWKKYVRGL